MGVCKPIAIMSSSTFCATTKHSVLSSSIPKMYCNEGETLSPNQAKLNKLDLDGVLTCPLG